MCLVNQAKVKSILIIKCIKAADLLCTMKLLERILISIVCGVSVYALFFFMAGQDGFWAQEQLRTQSMELSLHKKELEKTHEELVLECDALRYDSDVIRSYAKKLDYVSPGEVLVKITGLPPRTEKTHDIGFVKFMQPISYVSENVCKLAGLTIGVGVCIMLYLLDYKKKQQDWTMES